MSVALGLLATALAIYAAIVLALFLLQRSFLYVPFGGVPDPAEAGVPEMAAVTLQTADGLALLAWWRPPATPNAPTLVYFHGNGGGIHLRGGKVRPFLDAGFGVLLPAWRGYNGNPGRPSEAGLFADGRAALAFVAAAGIPPERVVLYGESLGSGVAVRMASETPVAAVVLEAPYSSIVDIAQARFPWTPARWLVRDRFDSAAIIAAVRAPILIVHGVRDLVVPIRFGERLFAAATEPKRFVRLPEAAHNDLFAFGAAEEVLRFLRQLPVAAAAADGISRDPAAGLPPDGRQSPPAARGRN